MPETSTPAASPETLIRAAVESDFFDHCGHIFEWDPAWNGAEGDLHCPECLGRAGILASQIAAALEPSPLVGGSGADRPASSQGRAE